MPASRVQFGDRKRFLRVQGQMATMSTPPRPVAEFVKEVELTAELGACKRQWQRLPVRRAQATFSAAHWLVCAACGNVAMSTSVTGKIFD